MAMKRKDRSVPPVTSPLFTSPLEEEPLHEKVRSALQVGKIPNRTPDKTRAVSRVGVMCAICKLPVARAAEVGVQIQFTRDGDNPGLNKYNFHIRCYAAWEFERRRDGH